MTDRGIRAILEEFPFSGRYKDRQEDALAVYLYEKLAGTRKSAYEEADISETSAVSIDETYGDLSGKERVRLMWYLAPIYEEISREDGGENL